MRIFWCTALACLLLAGCAGHDSHVASDKNPVDCVLNGPCTGAPTHAAPR